MYQLYVSQHLENSLAHILTLGQRAHLTCDEGGPYTILISTASANLSLDLGRPCQRCIKKGISDSCTEGHRKKAKYLLDEDELGALESLTIL